MCKCVLWMEGKGGGKGGGKAGRLSIIVGIPIMIRPFCGLAICCFT